MNEEVNEGWFLFNPRTETYESAGSKLLANISERLSARAEILAAFLLGSAGRGTQDSFSDMDIVIISDNAHGQDDFDDLFKGLYPIIAHFVKNGKHVIYLGNPLLKLEITVLREHELAGARTFFSESRITDVDRAILFDKTHKLKSQLEKWSVPPGHTPSNEDIESIADSFLYYYESINPAFQRGDMYRAFFHYSLAYNKLASFIYSSLGRGDFLYQPDQFFGKIDNELKQKLIELAPSPTPSEIRNGKERMFDLFMEISSQLPDIGSRISEKAISLRRYVHARYPQFWRLRDISLFGNCQPGLVYRSSRLDRYGADELIAWLSDNGITTLVDFRSEDEISSHGYDARVREAVVYCKIPFWPSSGRDKKNETGKVQEERLLEIYSGALDSHDFHQTLRSFFLVLSEKRNLPLVFHCHAGVDRTGLVTAMLLKLLDTSDEQIVGDYLISSGHARLKYITSFLRSLNRYGSPMQYLQDIGLSRAVVENVRMNLSAGQAKDEDDVSNGGNSGIV